MIEYRNNRHGRPMIISIGEDEFCVFAYTVDAFPTLDCTDTTARYIDMLEELIGIAKWVGNSDFGARSQQAKYIITYAEGNDE